VAESGDLLDNPVAGFRLRLVRTSADTDGELLEMEATYRPSSTPPLEHFHPNQVEHFEILEGVMKARIDGEERELRAGDTLDIDSGVVHAMWNPGPEVARTRWETRPALRTEDFFEATARIFRQAKESGQPPDGEELAAIVARHQDEFGLPSSG
jgi:mannose-6-phosphate isomerase-like protein (cupin superfamily)